MEVSVKNKLRKRAAYKSVISDAFTRRFLRKFPQHANEIAKTKDARQIINLFHGEVIGEMQKNPFGVILPKNFAVLFIENCGPTKKRAIDYANTKKFGKLIYHTNMETEGNLMKLKFLNHILPSGVSNNKFYYFLPSSKMKSRSSEYFKKNWAKCISYKPIKK